MISPEQQIVLAKEYLRTRDPKLEDQLVRSLLRLAAAMANRYPRDRDDLYQEGCLGVVQAVRHFDPARGVRLSTYAAWWIRAYQLRWLMANHRLVRIGKTARQRRFFFQAHAVKRRLSVAGLDDSPAAVARELGVDADQLEADLRSINAREVSLDGPLTDQNAAPDEKLGAAEAERIVSAELARFLLTLEPRDRLILRSRWMSDSPPSLRVLGKRLGVSRERVRQIEHRLLKRMRKQLPADLAA
jgi:RNA polymerase sigma-32 factor